MITSKQICNLFNEDVDVDKVENLIKKFKDELSKLVKGVNDKDLSKALSNLSSEFDDLMSAVELSTTKRSYK